MIKRSPDQAQQSIGFGSDVYSMRMEVESIVKKDT